MARILTMSDDCNLPTGMGVVHREIALGLHNKGHDVQALGWFSSPNRPNNMPFPVHATANQHYGQDVLDEVIQKVRPDILITIGDAWMIAHVADPNRCRTRRMFQWVAYTPIDGAAYGEVLPPTWKPIFRDADVLVAYTEYGKRIMTNSLPDLAEEIRLIPHGVDTKVFFPLPIEERKRLRRTVGIDRQKEDGTFEERICYLIVARNQFRKNIPELAKAWKKFTAGGAHPKAVLWPHMVFTDAMGWNMDEVFDIVDIRKTLVYFNEVAHSPHNLKLIPEADLNRLYNACDVHLTLAGEGFGLPTAEAMACGKPVIVLDHSANTELARGRGELVDVSVTQTGKYSTERPLPDHESLLKAMDTMYRYKEKRQTYGAAAYKFITEGDPNLYGGKPLTWAAAVDEWDKLVNDVMHPLSRPVKMREVC